MREKIKKYLHLQQLIKKQKEFYMAGKKRMENGSIEMEKNM